MCSGTSLVQDYGVSAGVYLAPHQFGLTLETDNMLPKEVRGDIVVRWTEESVRCIINVF